MLGTLGNVGRVIGRRKFDTLIKNIDGNVEELLNKENNIRMNEFSEQITNNLKQNNRTLYAEERNVGNKEILEDRQGLKNAYASPSGLYSTGKTLYISGTTGKDGSITRDILDDLIHLPTRNAEQTEKYKDVMNYLKNNPQITRLVSHSLGSAVANTLNENFPNRFQTTTYATPAIKPKRRGRQDPKHRDYRNPNDPVSLLDGYAITSNLNEPDPIKAHGYENFDFGRFSISPTTKIDNGISPNSSLKI